MGVCIEFDAPGEVSLSERSEKKDQEEEYTNYEIIQLLEVETEDELIELEFRFWAEGEGEEWDNRTDERADLRLYIGHCENKDTGRVFHCRLKVELSPEQVSQLWRGLEFAVAERKKPNGRMGADHSHLRTR